MNKKSLVIIAGPSAVGKTTIAHAILKLDPRVEFVRSVTTRAKRGDAFDDEYLYITREEFLSLIPVGGVLEHTEYAGSLYGTPRSEVERITGEGRIPLLVLDTTGVESISRFDDIATCGVYVYDDINVMEERLYARFLGASPTTEGLRKFASRKEQNVADYKRIYMILLPSSTHLSRMTARSMTRQKRSWRFITTSFLALRVTAKKSMEL